MRTPYNTLLTLQEWAEIIGVNPYYLNQLNDVDDTKAVMVFDNTDRVTCENVVFEYTWHVNELSRDDIWRAISQAEEMFVEDVGYYPAPKWRSEKHSIDNYNMALRLQKKLLISLGTYSYTDVGTYTINKVTDFDYAGKFSFLIPIADLPTGYDIKKLKFYYADSELPLGDEKENWEIRPLYRKVVGTDVLIVGSAFNLVKADLVDIPNPYILEISYLDHYIDEIQVWYEDVDDTLQGNFYYNNRCIQETNTICNQILNYRFSYLLPFQATFSVVNDEWTYTNTLSNPACRTVIPNFAEVNYISGYPRQANGKMDMRHAQIIAWLATSLLTCENCTCACNPVKHYMEPYSKSFEYPTSNKNIMDYKWGYARGAVMAWNAVKDLIIYEGITLD